MLKWLFSRQFLHHNRLTFAAAKILFQRIESFHQVALCGKCMTTQQGNSCCEPKHAPQKLPAVYKKCLFNICRREFYCGTLSQHSEKTNENTTVSAFVGDGEQLECESSKDVVEIDKYSKELDCESSKEVVIVDHHGKGRRARKLNHRIRDVSEYMDNIVDEIIDLEKTPPEVPAPELDVPKYYKPKSIVETILIEKKQGRKGKSRGRDNDNSDIVEMSVRDQLRLAERGELVVTDVEKVELPSTFRLDEVVNDSNLLQALVKVGVDLTSLQKKGMINTVMRLHHKKEMAPYIFFLRDNGVPEDQVGRLITRCPWIFQHSLHNLQVRVDYLRSKKFKIEHISNMLDKDPKFLLIPVHEIDARLGYIQKLFNLTGEQMRSKVGGYSKLIIAPSVFLQHHTIVLEKEFGFSKDELKTMFLAFPKIFHREPKVIIDSFDYVHDVMGIPHSLIAQTPQVLNTSKRKIECRHRFLVKHGRDQYDPVKENYVSLMSLISIRDEEWCLEIAKRSVAEYNQFLKLI